MDNRKTMTDGGTLRAVGEAVAVSVVVPTHNRANQLRRCLASLTLARAGAGSAVEIVVVDDGSSDATGRVLADAFARGEVTEVLRHETASGPACARNRGWKSARAELIAFTDDDCEVDPGWIAALVTAVA